MTKVRQVRQTRPLRLSAELTGQVESLAKQHKRSFNSEVEWALEQYIKEEIMSWLEKRYPVGREVEAVDQNDELQDGTVENQTETRGVTDGIIVRFEDGSRNEYEASFLDESGNGPFVHDRR